MSGRRTCHRFLCLGGGEGWHANQLRDAAVALNCEMRFASYQSLQARVEDQFGCRLSCEAGPIDNFDAILTRTMPAGSLEQVIFRLATLHSISEAAATTAIPIVNPPRSLEIAIDKFATLAHVSKLGFSVPVTMVVQSRREAMDAFAELGGDCIVKPVFGGEGRGVMRIQDPELAWTTFSALEQLAAVCYVQRFVPPGGSDTRLLVVGEQVIGVRRQNKRDFRTNVASGGRCQPLEPSEGQITMATTICRSIGLRFAAVDLIDNQHGAEHVLEVNAIPGWKGAQEVSRLNIAQQIIRVLMNESMACEEARC